MFVRELSKELIESLKKEELFRKKLIQDINEGKVFPAIRKNRVDFYYQGGKLFTYDGQFKTHIKYASVYRLDEEKNYVTQEDLSSPMKCNFIRDYKRIKENCSKFAGIEATGVSNVYSKYSYVKKISGAMVLDIEISFESDAKSRSQDRIDLLLLHNRVLRFYEAKHFSNSEIWAKLGSKPKVVNQVERYQRQILKNESDIIGQYQNYVGKINEIFDLKIDLPEKVEYDVPILVFGYDRDQSKGRLKSLFKENLKRLIKYYPIGDITGININNMWNACK